MAASIYDWSTTAGNNATADIDINWAEGMFPSVVNDSARQMMTRLAEYVGDNGVLTATGTANVITLTTNASITNPPNGMTVSFKALATNTGAVTLGLNGGAGLKLRKVFAGDTDAVDLDAADITAKGVYVAHYDASANSNAGAWILINPTNYLETTGSKASDKATPADGDYLTGVAAGGSTMFKTTWANIKAALRSAFDIVYVGLTNTQTITGTKIYQGSPGNIGANVIGIVEIQPQNGSNIDAFMSFHIPADSRRVNLGLRPSSAMSVLIDSFGIGGGSLGAVFYNFWTSGHFGRSADADIILGGGAAYNVYTAGALLAAINNRASVYANAKTAPQNCSHSSGVVEFGSIVPFDAASMTVDLPNPYVMTGLRTEGINSNRIYLRGKSIKNTA